MAGPFNMPDEYVQGFFKAGQSLVQSLTGAHSDAPASETIPAGVHASRPSRCSFKRQSAGAGPSQMRMSAA